MTLTCDETGRWIGGDESCEPFERSDTSAVNDDDDDDDDDDAVAQTDSIVLTTTVTSATPVVNDVDDGVAQTDSTVLNTTVSFALNFPLPSIHTLHIHPSDVLLHGVGDHVFFFSPNPMDLSLTDIVGYIFEFSVKSARLFKILYFCQPTQHHSKLRLKLPFTIYSYITHPSIRCPAPWCWRSCFFSPNPMDLSLTDIVGYIFEFSVKSARLFKILYFCQPLP